MNDVIFNNDVKVTVTQNPEIAEDGDTVEFLATPELLFATEDRTATENYSFTYIWMVSYDGGLSYQKTGIGTDKLTLENINTKIFNNSIYKVKVILEDLEDFLLTENGDRILTQIGEILLFNDNNTLLSAQTDVVTNDTTVTSISNTTDVSNTALNFLNIEGTIDEVAVFDNTITEDVRAEILSLQSRIDINNQAKFVDGEVTESASLPSTPNTDIELPNQTLSIQSECYVAVKKTFGTSPVIQYEVCEPSGASGLFTNCANSSDFNTLTECTLSGACDGNVDLYCEADTGVVEFNNIRFPNCTGNCSCCCDSVENACDTTDIWDKCEETYSQELPSPAYTDGSGVVWKKYNYIPPCGSAINCVTEEYVPSPKFFIANNCSATEGWIDSNSGATVINTALDRKNYCDARCKGDSATADIPGLAMVLTSWFTYLFYQVYYIGGIISGDVFVRTYCNGDGQKNGTLTGSIEKAVIKECKLKVCKQKWVCKGRTDNYSVNNGTETGAHFEFSRVDKDGGPSMTVGGVSIKTDRLVTPNSSHIKNDGPPSYNCDTSGGTISFERKENTCQWKVVGKCCPSGKNCTWTVDETFKLANPGSYPTFTLDATKKTINTDKLYSINRSLPLDFIETKDSCNAKCSGEGCKVYEEWKILSIDPTDVPCNQDFDIVALNEINDGGHGQNGSEIIVATDSKCTQENTPANRKVKIAKIVKRYTHKDPGDKGSYANVMVEVYSKLGYIPGNNQLYFNAYLIKYEEQSVSIPEVMLQIGAINNPNNSPYIKVVKTFNKEKLFRHSAILLTETTPLNRNCDKCSPVYLVSNPSSLAYPCNDRSYVIPGCLDDSGNPLPAAYGGCLKDSSDKTTPINIVLITEIKEPTDLMIKLLDDPNTDYFRTSGAAKAEGLKRVGSTGIVCSGPSI